MNVIQRAAAEQQAFTKMEQNVFGYETKTTFWSDFTIGELVSGVDGVKDTFKRAFAEWKSNVEYLTELVMVLNHKCWNWYRKDDELCQVYSDLYYEANDYAYENLQGDDLTYYFNILD